MLSDVKFFRAPYQRGDNGDGGNSILEAVGDLDDGVGIDSFRGDDDGVVDALVGEARRGNVLALLMLTHYGGGGDATDGSDDGRSHWCVWQK